MAFFINPIEEEQCVCLSYEGEVPAEELAAGRYQTHGLLNAKRWARIMVDLTQLRSFPATAELCDFAQGLAGQVPRSARVALVIRPDQSRHARLVESVARRNGAFLTYFLDPEKAALWMRQGRPACPRDKRGLEHDF
jgi:hypothetical protein